MIMVSKSINTAVVIPNWNGIEDIATCLDSLLTQTLVTEIIVVENGSTDGSVEFIQKNYPQVTLLVEPINLGFAGGVNVGIRYALGKGYEFIALFNNDAVADKNWLKNLVSNLKNNKNYGIATCKLMTIDKSHLDSTGDQYTNWGLPYPRGRGETNLDAYDTQTDIFAGSGGASLYRVSMLQEIGLFDEDFFAYYEDVDVSFRAQLAGWKVVFEPTAVAYHKIGASSGKIKGFTTYQTMKNHPLVLWKNVPRKYLFTIGWRFFTARMFFFAKAIVHGHGWYAIKGDAKGTMLLFKKTKDRKHIQKNKKVSDEYIWSIITHDLPANAANLRNLRSKWWKITKKGV